MRVQHNIPAMNSYRNYNNNAKAINKNLEKLSSGYRINRAGDDAAGLAISEKMRAQITGLEVAQKNAKDGISLVQTAEGALTEVHDMLNRMYALAEQAGNGTYDNTVDRNQLNKEVSKLRDEIDRIGSTTNFNGTKLFDSAARVQSGSTASGTFSGDITDVGVTEVTTNDADLDGETMTVKAWMNGSDKKFQVTFPTGYRYQGDTDNHANATLTNPADSVTLTMEKIGDTSKTLSVKLDFSSFTPDAAATSELTAKTGTLTLSVPSATLQAGETTAMGNTPTPLTVSTDGSIDLWVGDFPEANNKLSVELTDISSSTLKITSSTVNLTSQENALNSLSYIKDAIDKVSDLRGTLGAAQNRLEHTINNLSVMQENIQDAESTIRDTDVAEEMMKYTKNSILVQSAQAMLAQANQQPQSVLQLLQ